MIASKIQEFEQRPVRLGRMEQNQLAERIKHFSAINKFENIKPSNTDKRLFQLLITGRISTDEYLQLCINDAQNQNK